MRNIGTYFGISTYKIYTVTVVCILIISTALFRHGTSLKILSGLNPRLCYKYAYIYIHIYIYIYIYYMADNYIMSVDSKGIFSAMFHDKIIV